MESGFGALVAGGLLRSLGCGVFAVVVYYYYGEFAGVVLLEEAGYCLMDVGGFVAGWDYGEDAWPGAWGLVVCLVVIEIAETPEIAAGCG
jgi:hypothetical protein